MVCLLNKKETKYEINYMMFSIQTRLIILFAFFPHQQRIPHNLYFENMTSWCIRPLIAGAFWIGPQTPLQPYPREAN